MAVRRFVDRMYPGRKGTLMHSAVHEAAHVAVTGAAIAGAGYLANRYREKHLMGMPVDLAGGVGGTVAALLASRFARGKVAKLVPLLRAAGHAGLYSWAHTLGAGMGAQAAGVQRMIIGPGASPAAVKQKLAGAGVSVLGQIPKAPHGDWLSDKQLLNLARS